MSDFHPLAGLYTAAVSPLKADASSFDFESIPVLLNFLHSRGCHGVLFFGTTGEGPSFSPKEREAFLRSVRAFKQQARGMKMLVGTGTPSLSETIDLTKLAFDLGFDGTVVLPPYYFRKATDEGLYMWFSELIKKAVPSKGHLLGYHIPGAAGIGFSLDLLARLKDAFPNQFAGIKDSSHDEAFSKSLGDRFGKDLLVLNGTDSHFHHALKNSAQGAITAAANVISPELRKIWDQFNEGKDPAEAQKIVTAKRHALEKYAPFPPVLKALLNQLHGFPNWGIKPPLDALNEETIQRALKDFIDA